MIAVLFAQARGTYAGFPDVDVWDKDRDARRYSGPYPVVAHPPCARWCRLAGLVEAVHGIPRGEDGGCFRAALESVRAFGGVLEHPAHSAAFDAHGLSRPARGGWQRCLDGGWVTEVFQGNYGHRAAKATWLYAFRAVVPSLDWRLCESTETIASSRRVGDRTEVTKSERSATPPAFRDVLLSMARSCHRVEVSSDVQSGT